MIKEGEGERKDSALISAASRYEARLAHTSSLVAERGQILQFDLCDSAIVASLLCSKVGGQCGMVT
jgi:hypothetical protein